MFLEIPILRYSRGKDSAEEFPADVLGLSVKWIMENTNFPHVSIMSDSVLPDDEFIPFDPPIVSKYGPISRMSKTILRPSNTVQVSASFGEGTISTPVVCRPVPAASPVASWYFNAGQGPVHSSALASTHHVMASGASSTSLGDGYITIGHGILDPPQLFIQNRNAECSSDNLLLESQKVKHQLRNLQKKINDLKLATQGAVMSEGEKLTQELQLIEQGICEKEMELRLNQLVSASLTSPTITAVALNKDGSLNWSLKAHGEYRSDDEDTYEAGIANDMLELERRWEFELEEQEKRWSSEEETGKK